MAGDESEAPSLGVLQGEVRVLTLEKEKKAKTKPFCPSVAP